MAEQIKKNSELIEISLEAIPFFTIWGKIQYRYKLSDFTYGNWIIFENNKPKYYLNLYDNDYDDIREKFSKSKDFDLESTLKTHKKNLSIHQNFWGISLWNKSFIQFFHLKKMPSHILKN